MSVGIRSGVNWMRLVSRPSTMARVSTSLVLARPGTPISRPWPPASRVTSALFDHIILAENHLAETLLRRGEGLGRGVQPGRGIMFAEGLGVLDHAVTHVFLADIAGERVILHPARPVATAKSRRIRTSLYNAEAA